MPYHPYHAFSMMSCGHLAEKHTAQYTALVHMNQAIARGMGMKTRATFEEAIEDAKKYVEASRYWLCH